MKIRQSRRVHILLLLFTITVFLIPGFYGLSSGEEEIYYWGSTYVFTGNWTWEEIKIIARLQDKAKALLENCQGYITPEEQDTILQAYHRPIILHIKNNNLGKNIGAAVARTRQSDDTSTPLALEVGSPSVYSAMQINVQELLPRGEKEILKTLLHEMAHNASPGYTHPLAEEIWGKGPGGGIKSGRKWDEYFESVPIRVENCARNDANAPTQLKD